MRRAIVTLLVAFAAGCAEPPPKPKVAEETVVVLPGPGGRVGTVVVERAGQQQVLNEAYAASSVSTEGQLSAARSSEETVKSAFATTLGALPARPATFMLYFVTGKDELTPESKVELAKILEELKQRPSPDVVAIGHTDTVGSPEANDRLSLQRAERVRAILAGIGIPAEKVFSAGRGERELLVPTADNVDEPRNRRVEINVR